VKDAIQGWRTILNHVVYYIGTHGKVNHVV